MEFRNCDSNADKVKLYESVKESLYISSLKCLQSCAKIIEKTAQVKKSETLAEYTMRNINRIYNNAALQLPSTIADFKTFKSYGIWLKGSEKLKLQPSTQCSRLKFNFIVILFKIAKNQKNVYFKSRFSVKPSRFPIYFAYDSR